MRLLKHQYYDHPEGSDASGKLIATNKIAVSSALVWSTYDVLMITKPQGYFKTLNRYAYWTLPAMGMATAFTLGTYAATNLRGKDDIWNYVVGASGSGAILGAWRGSIVAGSYFALIFSIAGAVKKLSKIEGWEFFPEFKSLNNQRNYDWTLLKDPGKTWTTGKE